MFKIDFQGYLECPSIEAFQIAFQQFLNATKGHFYGQIIPSKLPDYVDYQEIIEDDTEGNTSTDLQPESGDNTVDNQGD